MKLKQQMPSSAPICAALWNYKLESMDPYLGRETGTSKTKF